MTRFQPIFHISPLLLERIKQIAVLVHELNKRVVPDIILTQIQAEARAVSTYASTSIEGNPLPLTEVKRLLKKHPDHLRQSEQEIINYNQVLTDLGAQPEWQVTKALLLQIHQGVTKQLLPAHQSSRFRQEPVVVHDPRTGEVVYLPPDHGDVESLIDVLLAFVEANQDKLDPLLLAGILHKQLVVIHPFVDGNGRTARLASKILLARLGLNLFNLFSFENYYNQNVTRYFEHVGLSGNYYDLVEAIDFTPWLEYFAGGILDELLRVQKVIEKKQASPATTLKSYHQQILDTIDSQGFITDQDYARLTDRAKATRTKDFNHLIALGLIVRHGRGRSTHYRRSDL
jgi:Fic family protein